MNERIKELAEQARRDSFGMIENPQDPTEWSKYHDTFEEKFAELIIRECIDYCGENLSKTVGGALKIHFGVEE